MKQYAIIFFSALLFSGCATNQKYVEVKIDSSLKYTDSECENDAFGSCNANKVVKIDKIVVFKSQKKLYTYKGGKVVDSFRISMGKNWDKGHKQRKGDYKTPEGSYTIAYKQHSRNYYKSLRISYPNALDKAKARRLGVSPGGLIMIHGQPRWNATGIADDFTLKQDWTAGCIALTNTAMDRLFYATKSGIPIEIRS